MLQVMIAAETTKVKKMDDNCAGNRKEYSGRADRQRAGKSEETRKESQEMSR